MIQLAISKVQTAARSFRLLGFKDVVSSQTSVRVNAWNDSDLRQNFRGGSDRRARLQDHEDATR